jgi:hypothetical protein
MSQRKNQEVPIYHPDYSFKKGDLVCEYIPYPNQPDGPWNGPRKRYTNRVGTFLGNQEKGWSYSSWVLVDNVPTLICRCDLCFYSGGKS